MKNIVFKSILILFSIAFLESCTSDKIKIYNSTDEMVSEAGKNVQYVTPQELKTLIDNKSKMNIIDCREEEEYEPSCIPGAINIPRGLIEFLIGDKVDSRRTPLYIYCSNDERSTLVASILPKLKFSNVYVLDGGFEAWTAAYPEAIQLLPGGETETKTKSAAPSGGCGG